MMEKPVAEFYVKSNDGKLVGAQYLRDGAGTGLAPWFSDALAANEGRVVGADLHSPGGSTTRGGGED
jgi:hypothetical protein